MIIAPSHKRSKSYPGKITVDKDDFGGSVETSSHINLEKAHVKEPVETRMQSPSRKVHENLKQEILQLEKRLRDQLNVRCALEKALGYRSFSHDDTSEISIPKSAIELIKDIAVLELEVVHLEQYLLSLYRKAFDQQISSVSPSAKDEKLKSPVTTPRRRTVEVRRPVISSQRENLAVKSSGQLLSTPLKESSGVQGEDAVLDPSVHRCHSNLSQRSGASVGTSPADPRAVRACYSQPLSMMEYAQNTSSVISLAEHLGTRISDLLPETPNKLSEDMIKCMSAIYCKLSDPPSANPALSSPSSPLSSASPFYPEDHGDLWSPGLSKDPSFDAKLDNPFHIQGLKEFSGPYSTMVEVPWIYRDGQKLGDIENLLQNFKCLISRLEDVDVRKMKHEEKLAFWINVHNALVMHAFLAYGIPKSSMKRLFLLLKAAYNVGGQTISADTIQNSILGCRMCRPGQWLNFLLSTKKKFKTGDERQPYAIDHPEPLLHFALCSGSHSDPAVRAYTPKRVFQELETAKEEYIRATFGIRKDQKILLPKIIESFAKDSSLCPAGVMEMVQQSLPDSLRKSIRKSHLAKSSKLIQWVPHNFTFRYLISKELVK